MFQKMQGAIRKWMNNKNLPAGGEGKNYTITVFLHMFLLIFLFK